MTGGEGLFHLTGYSPSVREVSMGASRNLVQKPGAEAMGEHCMLACLGSCLVSFLYILKEPAQGKVPPAVDCVLRHQLTTFHRQSHRPVWSWQFPGSQMTLRCVRLTVRTRALGRGSWPPQSLTGSSQCNKLCGVGRALTGTRHSTEGPKIECWETCRNKSRLEMDNIKYMKI